VLRCLFVSDMVGIITVFLSFRLYSALSLPRGEKISHI
jgi:hypothetical protein